MTWQTIHPPAGLPPPEPITGARPGRPGPHTFPEHAHDWHQLACVISGLLTAAVEGRTSVISPEQALWLPAEAPGWLAHGSRVPQPLDRPRCRSRVARGGHQGRWSVTGMDM